MGFREDMFEYFDKAVSTPNVGRVTVNASQLFDLLILARKGAHAEGQEVTPIPQHMRAKPGERHPQNDEEHNPANDREGHVLARSVARINYAADYADPRAPDQMALVWRIDLLRLSSDWQHKRAYFEHTKDVRAPDYIGGALRESSAAVARLLHALHEFAPDHPDMAYARQSQQRSAEALRYFGTDGIQKDSAP
jgi:hypothetical protein